MPVKRGVDSRIKRVVTLLSMARAAKNELKVQGELPAYLADDGTGQVANYYPSGIALSNAAQMLVEEEVENMTHKIHGEMRNAVDGYDIDASLDAIKEIMINGI